MSKGPASNGDGADVPPPPPPPPPPVPQGQRPLRVTNGGAVQSLLNIKTYPSPLIKSGEALTSAVGPSSTMPQMVPPSLPTTGTVRTSGGTVAVVPLPASKPQLTSTLQTPLCNLLSNVKNPQKLQNDLTAQLAAIKGIVLSVT